MAVQTFMYLRIKKCIVPIHFLIRKYINPRFVDKRVYPPPPPARHPPRPVVYATDGSKAVILVLLCSALWLLLRACHFGSCLALCARVYFFFFLVLVSILITSLGEERAGLCASRAFVCLFWTP